jgi:tetratricopeptide (TPR) repeat protein
VSVAKPYQESERRDELEYERDFLLRSLEDLEEEREAGDVSLEDYDRLRDSYTTRAAKVLRALEIGDLVDDGVAVGPAPPSEEKKRSSDAPAGAVKTRHRKRGLLIGGIVLLVIAVVIAIVLKNTSDQLPDNPITGSGPTLGTQQQIQREISQAEILESDGEYSQALPVYQKVISQDPENSTAYAEAGWIAFEAAENALPNGQSSQTAAAALEQGQSYELKAVTLAPKSAVPHAFLGTIYFKEGEFSKAVVQYGEFIALVPTEPELSPFLPDIKLAYSDAKQTLPPLPDQVSTSTTAP